MSAALSLRCLVLNADFRPISTWPLSLVSAQEAIGAVFRDRVTVVEHWPGAVLRSANAEHLVPKVAALRTYAPIAARPKFCRRSILLRDGYCCQYCGDQFPPEQLTFDHVIPRSKGGQTCWENILCACADCNARKRNLPANYSGRAGKVASDGRMRPLKEPRQPTTAELLRAGLRFLPNDLRENYRDWLYWEVPLEP